MLKDVRLIYYIFSLLTSDHACWAKNQAKPHTQPQLTAHLSTHESVVLYLLFSPGLCRWENKKRAVGQKTSCRGQERRSKRCVMEREHDGGSPALELLVN